MIEKRSGNHFEGVPFYGLRSDLTGQEIASRFTRNKRSNLESGYLGSSRDGLQQMQPHSLENSHIMKVTLSSFICHNLVILKVLYNSPRFN